MEFRLIDTEFLNQFNNGELLDQNLGDFTKNLVGNITDKIKTRQTIAVSWTAQSDSVNTFNFVGNTISTVSSDFINQGFTVGDIISIYDNAGSAFIISDRTITSLTPNQIVFNGAIVSTASYPNAKIYGKTPLESLRFKYGLIGNNEPTNFVSKIDGTAENSFSASGIGFDTGGGVRSLTPAALIASNGVNSWKSDFDSGTISFVSTGTQIENYEQKFEIIHYFSILPFYLDGNLSNIQNLIQPALFNSTNTLKYVYEAQFNTTLSNPNGTKIALVDSWLGSVGWYNESLNGNATPYGVRDLIYTNQDTLQVVTEINSQQKTKVQFTLTGNPGTFDTNTDVCVGIAILPTASDYQQNSNTIDQNFLLDRVFTKVDLSAVNGSIIKNYSCDFSSIGEIFVNFDVEYLVAEQSRLQNKNYIIFVSTADNSLNGGATDRTTVKIDSKLYFYNPDVTDLIFIDEILHFPHDEVNVENNENAFDDYKGWIEDGFSIKAIFRLNNDLKAKLQSLKVHFSAWNPSTDDRFDLQSYNYTLSGGVLIQPSAPLNPYFSYNVNSSRGFNLAPSNSSLFNASQFNQAVLQTFSTELRGSINVVKYGLLLGIKANFEDWISLPGANTVFYDPTKPNNGLNKNSSNYSLKEGYELIVIVEANVVDNNGLDSFSDVLKPFSNGTDYIFLSQPHAYYDYNLDNDSTANWTVIIDTIDEAGANTSGILQTNESTKIRATFTPLSGATNLFNPYGIIRLNQNGGNIQTIFELSSILPSALNNPLIPMVGESFTKLTDNGSTVVLECLVDGSILDASVNYDISATMRDDSSDSGLSAISTEIGVLISTELNDIIIIE
tara:strand:+ start:1989 stop:4505 length:2517 start_codon:yes stop_codon:yes gene_type:complete